MSIDDFKNKAEDAAGKVKESAGEATGNDDLANEGRADQVKSDVKDAVSNAKDKASEAINKVIGGAKE